MGVSDTERLRELAGKAPQQGPLGISGPWTGGRPYSPHWTVEPAMEPLGTVALVTVFGGGEEQAAYIAAASPTAILALLDERDRLRRELNYIRTVAQGIGESRLQTIVRLVNEALRGASDSGEARE